VEEAERLKIEQEEAEEKLRMAAEEEAGRKRIEEEKAEMLRI